MSAGISLLSAQAKGSTGLRHQASGLGGASLVLWHVPKYEAIGWGKFASLRYKSDGA